MEYIALLMFGLLILLLLSGFPVAFVLGAISLVFGSIYLGFDFFQLLPFRIWGIMTNFTLLAVPLFVFMGVVLEKSGVAEELLDTMGRVFGRIRGGSPFPWSWLGHYLPQPPASWAHQWLP